MAVSLVCPFLVRQDIADLPWQVSGSVYSNFGNQNPFEKAAYNFHFFLVPIVSSVIPLVAGCSIQDVSEIDIHWNSISEG